ncbi:MAG: hypothetical protein COW25_00655 [Candidatus Nealsonbacteria bacterium CG15_BIG_FIL_POST_REV_8_21_14_020_37_12]|uniref:Homing endonuclease LAGLIDADG domain-containing protein n=1 Tax=Candidatus Nealsonbacteria bacterium CG15_BIG_FIL_POST_REV_8_21_14_020_37_12 TaxID=1974716 RepID=A0A2M7H1Q3_9BACT|nr:MAG: hypothetical protein COW25_00655 [Candidatus Nealsonbacteria bacterium CG15_BIG_FIL_POST_REV_8_21_14_020_37_12]
MIKSFLSEQCKEVILGSLLGDGSLRIHHQYKNARFSFRHSVKQKEYFFWKIKQLKEISGEKCWWIQSNNALGGDKLRYQSLALESLTSLYELTHKGQRLHIRRKWLNMLTPLSLTIWWLDDGSLITNGRRGVLCTDSFSYKEQKILSRYLYKVWKVKVAIGKIHREWNGKQTEYYRLWIRSSEELQKLLRIILPHVKVSSMLPKVLLLYKNIDLQQRWISEVHKATGFSQAIIEKYLNEKKSRWKKFRE